jgi:hypothetical protein
MTRRDINWVLIVKTVWLTVGLSVWQMGLGSCMTAPDCWLPEAKFVPVLGLLSFPSGPLFIVLNGIVVDSFQTIDVSPALFYSFECLGMTAVGYVQWFHVVPRLFGKPEITALSLNLLPATSACKQEAPRTRIPQPRVRVIPVTPFDEAGRTPLERVINS